MRNNQTSKQKPIDWPIFTNHFEALESEPKEFKFYIPKSIKFAAIFTVLKLLKQHKQQLSVNAKKNVSKLVNKETKYARTTS